jgi:hypothetical protein
VLIASPNLLEGQKLDGSMDKEGAVFVNVWNHNGEWQFVHWACEHKEDLSRCPCKTGVSGQILCLHTCNLSRFHQCKLRSRPTKMNLCNSQRKLPQCLRKILT